MAIRIQAEWTGLLGSPYLTTIYTPGAGQVQADLGAETMVDFLTALAPICSAALDARVIPEAVDYSTPDTPVDVYPVAEATVGMTRAGVPLPPATQGLIQLRTNAYRGARRVQGRVFVPGVTSASLPANGQNPSPEYVTALNNAGSILVAGGCLVASRAGNEFYPIASATGWAEFAVLRSRRD